MLPSLSIKLPDFAEIPQCIFYIITLSILSVFAARMIILINDIHIWRHDAIYYLESYFEKLITEGRWINYLCFDLLKKINPHISIYISLLSISCFFYICARSFMNMGWSILLTIASLQIPSIWSLITWPVTPFLSFIFLAFIAFLKNITNYLFILATGSILLNGTFNNLYALLPLLFLANVYANKIHIFNFVIVYCIFFICGYLISQYITYLISGDIFHIASWRQPNIIMSFQDFVDNIEKSCFLFYQHLTVSYMTLVIFIFNILLIIIISIRYHEYSLNKLFFLDLISISTIYVQTLPIGIYIAIRTVHSVYLGILALLFPIFKYKMFRFLGMLSLILFAAFNYYQNYNGLIYYKIMTSLYYNNLIGITANPDKYKVLNLITTSHLKMIHNKIISETGIIPITQEYVDEPWRWVPCAREAGFSKIMGPQSIKKDELDKIYNSLKNLQFHTNNLYRYVFSDGYLIIDINPDFLHVK